MTATYTGIPSVGAVISNSPTAEMPTYLGDGVSGFYVWGAQAELGDNASTLISTTTGGVTRNADTLTELAAVNITASAGAIAGTFSPSNTSTSRVCRVYVDASNYIALDVTGGGTVTATKTVAGVSVTQSLGTVAVGSAGKMAISWGAGGFHLAVNGASVSNASTTVLASLPTNIEYSASSNIFTLKEQRAFPIQLTAAQLALLTA
jgi:hypothetical protein